MDSNNRLIQTLETAGETDYLLMLISLFFCIISSFILMYVYKNKANSLSSKIQISMIIPLLSNITFLVILILINFFNCTTLFIIGFTYHRIFKDVSISSGG